MRALLSCFSWFWENLIRKTSPLVLGKILSVFVTILAADDKYPVEDWENLQLPIQMQLSEKRKNFLEFFVPFLDSTSKFKHFEKKKMMVMANVFPKLQTMKNFVRPLCKNPCFGTRFNSQDAKVSGILEEPTWEHFCHEFSSFWDKSIWKLTPLLFREIFGCFLTHWLLMASIRLKICRICNFPCKIQ